MTAWYELMHKEETAALPRLSDDSERRAERVAKNYEKKLELYREFQRGKNFSLYEEKRKTLASKQHTLDLEL